MAKIDLFDGTRETKYGQTLMDVLKELARLQRVAIKPVPGGIDMYRYNIVKNLEKAAFNPQRRQVDLDRFLDYVWQTPEIMRQGTEKIILLERDIYTPNTRWCFGSCPKFQGVDLGLIILSTARIQNKDHWFYLLAHEIGHMYGAAPRGRTNTEENLGSHCLNDLCVMQQKLTVSESVNYARRIHREGKSPYCSQCQNDIRKA